MRKQVVLSSTCVLALALSACGGGGGVQPTPTPIANPAPPPPAPTPTPSPQPGTNFNTSEYNRSNGAVSSGAITAWQNGSTGSGVKLAVVDSGLNASLGEFAGRVDSASRDVAGSRGVSDEDGHGTAVTATAAAARNDAHTVGVAFDATILSFRADSPGTCASTDGCAFYDSAIAQGIDAARSAGARVINLSLGGSQPGSQLLSAMQRAVSAGIILVISAGNDGEDPVKGANADPFALIPAQQFPGQVIIAGSVGVDNGAGGTDLNQLSVFSNKAGTGANYYLTALGYRVRTINQDGVDYLYSGTSFSAPIISGAVALMAQAFPNLTASQIVDLLFRTADDLGATGTDSTYGRGRLNIARAFQPVGTTSLANSAVPVTDAAVSGSTPEAVGDGPSKGPMGAIILDGYKRAFVVDLAKGLSQAQQRTPLVHSLAGKVRSAAVQNGPLTVAMTVTERSDLKGVFDLQRTRVGPEDARKSRLVAGSALARIDAKSRAAFGIGESAKTIERQLTGVQSGAFLVARDVGADQGFEARRGTSMAFRRDLGFAGVTVATEDGKVWQNLPTRATGVAYRLSSVTIDRRLGDWSLGVGATRLSESETLLGGRLGDLFDASGSSTLFLDTELRRAFGDGWSAGLTARRGWTRFDSGRLRTSAYGFDVAKAGVFGFDDRFGLRIAQPLRAESGGLGIVLPTSYDYATETAGESLSRLSLTPTGREIDGEVSYSTSLGAGWIGGNLFARRQPGHVASADADVGAAIRYSLTF